MSNINDMWHEALSTIQDWYTYLNQRDMEQDRVLADIRPNDANFPPGHNQQGTNPLSWLGVGQPPATRSALSTPDQSPTPELVADLPTSELLEENPLEHSHASEILPAGQEAPITDAELELHLALTETTTGDLPDAVLDAMRSDDPERLPLALVQAHRQGHLPDRLAEAVGHMTDADSRYAEAAARCNTHAESEIPETWC
jgi:hypothetical protein